jgi:hypothetical protein
MQTSFIQITKRYIIDTLNLMFFEELCTWEGSNQYDTLPILTTDSAGSSDMEHRGVLLVHKRIPHALRVLITKYDGSEIKVCYRIKDITETCVINDPPKVVYPHTLAPIDFSISDQNLGAFQASSFTFANLNGKDFFTNQSQLVNLSSFILLSIPVVLPEGSIFGDMLLDEFSEVPLTTDSHFVPIYGSQPNVGDGE